MTAAPQDTTAPLAHADVIVLDYLAALWAESEDLSPEVRDELMTTVADYIAMRRTSVSDPLSDPEQIVGRLGPPEALVGAVRRGRMPAHLRLPLTQPPVPMRRPGPPPVPADRVPDRNVGSDGAAIALLMGGGFVLPVVAPLAGMLIASVSQRWTLAQKLASWTLVMGSVVAGFILSVIVLASSNAEALALFVAYSTVVTGSMIAGITLIPGLNRKNG
ncbi:hypothetical protein [Actinoplanes sp. NBRC 103695]|uniref:HAAS signaling domain-containing protein n=1 Tax=Actinoplanes sp. NBRC 103695 TaxID=3032202 RepID=UPI00249FB752|nr:hypothetical protein [Actinoplanes sp. NBRC 103695]GLY97953.1 hypothetical protein Acsp02_52070 [Actinoplanes sp. NBRC 103695]